MNISTNSICSNSKPLGVKFNGNKSVNIPGAYPESIGEDELETTKLQEYKYFPLKDHFELSPQEESTKQVMGDWIENFLAKPNDQLISEDKKKEKEAPKPNRSVCPFIPGALKRNSIFLAVDEAKKPDALEVEKKMELLKQDFLKMEPISGRESMFKTAIVTFPNLDLQSAPELIDGVQRKAKKSFVKDGLMIGEFHELNEAPGLWNKDFRPLRTPVPALAVRYMVDNDLLFLKDEKYSPKERVEFLKAFLDKNREFKRNTQAAQEALAKAESDLKATEASKPGYLAKLLKWY